MMINSIVHIESFNENNRSFGTGFVIESDEHGIYILTCQHVIDEVEIPVVEAYKAEIITRSDFIDMAVIYIKGFQLPALHLQIDKCASLNVEVIGFSHFNQTVAQKKHIFAKLFKETIELHSTIDDSFYLSRKIKANDDYTFDKGNSGSPVICKKSNHVIAMISNKRGSDIAYAIEISCLKEVWKELNNSLLEEGKTYRHQHFYNKMDNLKEKITTQIKERQQEKPSRLRYYLSGILTVILFYAAYYFFTLPEAYKQGNYKVIKIRSNDTLNVREDKGTIYDILGALPYDARNIAVKTCESNDVGKEWCSIRYGSLTGWVRSKYITIEEETSTYFNIRNKGEIKVSNNQLTLQLSYPNAVKQGQPLTLIAKLTNHGKYEQKGGITVSFPQRPLLEYEINSNDFKTIKQYKIGDEIYNNHKDQERMMSAIHPIIESESLDWASNQTHTFSISLTAPSDFSIFKIRIRATLTLNRVVPKMGIVDQQAFASQEVFINILK